MKTNELYLKTLFCCSACDGDIAPEEISLVKQLSLNESIFENLDVENMLNTYVDSINKQGSILLKDYLCEVANSTLSDDEQIKLIELAINTIEADNQILYSEVKFIKKIRNLLSVPDDCILEKLPYSEDYLLPDISSEDKDFEEIGIFEQISFAEVL